MPSLNTSRRSKLLIRSATRNATGITTRRRTKSVELQKESISGEIGSGGYGIVSRPAARCDISNSNNRNTYYNSSNYVSKLTTHESAKHELDICNYIKHTIPDHAYYFCLIDFICDAPKDKVITRDGDVYDTYAIIPYCGVTFNTVIDDTNRFPISIHKLCKLLRQIQILIVGLEKLHANHIYHKDIHGSNILYDIDSDTLRFIDFGLSKKYTEGTNSSILERSEYYDLYTLVDRVIMRYMEYIEPIIPQNYSTQIKTFIESSNQIIDSESKLKKIPNKLKKMQTIVNNFLQLKSIV